MINIPAIVELMEEAGKCITALKSQKLDVVYKHDGSECTSADLVSNKIITSYLQDTHPGIPIISEESVFIKGTDNLNKCDYIWFLDPLDGTKEFLRGGDNYSINLALLFKGKPVFGVISLPEKHVTYYNDNHNLFIKSKGQTQQIIPDNQKSDKLRVIISRRSDPEIIKAFFKKGIEYELTIQQGALKYCYLASGQFEIFPRYKETYEWDVAAGHALLKAIGGTLVTLNRQELIYLKKDFLNHELIAVRDPKYLKFLSRGYSP